MKNEASKNCIVLEARKKLVEFIKNKRIIHDMNLNEIENENDSKIVIKDEQIENIHGNLNLYQKWYENIVEKFLPKDSLPNASYNPKLADCIKRIFKSIPLWTSITNKFLSQKPNFEASSTNVKSFFRTTKCITLRDYKLPIRIDVFLCEYMKYLRVKYYKLK